MGDHPFVFYAISTSLTNSFQTKFQFLIRDVDKMSYHNRPFAFWVLFCLQQIVKFKLKRFLI